MQWPIAEIDTYVYYVDNVGGVFGVFHNLFKMSPRNMVQALDRQTTILYNSFNNLGSLEIRQFYLSTQRSLIKKISVDRFILSSVI